MASVAQGRSRIASGSGTVIMTATRQAAASADSTASKAAEVAASTPRRTARFAAGSGSMAVGSRWTATDAAAKSREHPGPDPGDHRRADGGGLLGQHSPHRPAEHIGLDRRPQVVPRAAADDAYLAVSEAQRVESFDDVAQRICAAFEHRARDVRRACGSSRGRANAPRIAVVPPRRGRPRQRGQEQHAFAGRWRLPCAARTPRPAARRAARWRATVCCRR